MPGLSRRKNLLLIIIKSGALPAHDTVWAAELKGCAPILFKRISRHS